MTAAARRLSWLPGLYIATLVAAAGAEFWGYRNLEPLLLWLARPLRAFSPIAAVAATVALVFVVGGLLALQQSRRPRRAPGRARLLAIGVLGALHAAIITGITIVVSHRAHASAFDAALGSPLGGSSSTLWLIVLGWGSASVCRLACLTAWPLLSRRARARTWAVVDSALLILLVLAIRFLPSEPLEQGPFAGLAFPVLRHVITLFAALRFVVRILPHVLVGIERTGFKQLVAARHLRSKKSGFLAAISLLSVLAVSLSCMALTITLSVMGGFRNDLKRKILGNNPHIMVDRDTGHIADWPALLGAIHKDARVTGAAPFVGGEVMLSSASNLATAVLRGIDPDNIGTVNDLPKNLRSGRLEYLEHPEQLLELPPDITRGSMLFGGGQNSLPEDEEISDLGRAGADANGAAGRAAATPIGVAAHADGHDDGHAAAEGGTRDRDAPKGSAAGAGDNEPANGKQASKRLDIERRLKELDALLRNPDATLRNTESRELLPGIIIGQELARALRLYVGDEVNVVAPLGALGPAGPMPKSRPYRVAGIFYSGMYEYDMKFTYVALHTAQAFLGTGDEVSGIEVRVTDVEQAPAVASALRAGLNRDDVRVRDWQALNSRLFGALALEKLAMFIALGIAILVASFCIAGTLTLMVQEKGREVAILKAMGTSDRAVVGVFVLEGGLIGMLGASLGLLLGYMACFAAEHVGIPMNPEVYYIARLPVHLDPTEFALTGIAAVLVCLVITIYPALLASRLRPVDALRYE